MPQIWLDGVIIRYKIYDPLSRDPDHPKLAIFEITPLLLQSTLPPSMIGVGEVVDRV